MAVGALLKYARDALFSKPSSDRELVKLARKACVRRIVEVGIESPERTVRLLSELARRDDGVTYSGFDAFEQREAGEEPLSLLATHRLLAGLGAKVRLTPGEPEATMAAMANHLPDSDLILLPRDMDSRSATGVWFYLPRMCHPGTVVLSCESDPKGADTLRVWPMADVKDRSLAASPAAAA